MTIKMCVDCKNKLAVGKAIRCSKCQYISRLIYRRNPTKFGIITLARQRESSRKRNMPLPNYSSQELQIWGEAQEIFKFIYAAWKASKYDKELHPSCDRIDNTQPYTLANIRLMTWKENRTIWHTERLQGTAYTTLTPVNQYTLKGDFIARYPSLAIAARAVNRTPAAIHNVLTGKTKSSATYFWSRAIELDELRRML